MPGFPSVIFWSTISGLACSLGSIVLFNLPQLFGKGIAAVDIRTAISIVSFVVGFAICLATLEITESIEGSKKEILEKLNKMSPETEKKDSAKSE